MKTHKFGFWSRKAIGSKDARHLAFEHHDETAARQRCVELAVEQKGRVVTAYYQPAHLLDKTRVLGSARWRGDPQWAEDDSPWFKSIGPGPVEFQASIVTAVFQLVKFLRSSGSWFGVAAVTRQLKLPAPRIKVRAALQALVDRGWLEPCPEGTKRSGRYWRATRAMLEADKETA